MVDSTFNCNSTESLKSPNTICWNEIIIIFAKELTNQTIYPHDKEKEKEALDNEEHPSQALSEAREG